MSRLQVKKQPKRKKSSAGSHVRPAAILCVRSPALLCTLDAMIAAKPVISAMLQPAIRRINRRKRGQCGASKAAHQIAAKAVQTLTAKIVMRMWPEFECASRAVKSSRARRRAG